MTEPSTFELRERMKAANRRLLLTIVTALWLTETALIGFVMYKQDVDNAEHRQRNELIHDCVNRKIDELRLDIYHLLKGQNPDAFPPKSAIHCPPLHLK